MCLHAILYKDYVFIYDYSFICLLLTGFLCVADCDTLFTVTYLFCHIAIISMQINCFITNFELMTRKKITNDYRALVGCAHTFIISILMRDIKILKLMPHTYALSV
jgi:hypothetical protein